MKIMHKILHQILSLVLFIYQITLAFLCSPFWIGSGIFYPLYSIRKPPQSFYYFPDLINALGRLFDRNGRATTTSPSSPGTERKNSFLNFRQIFGGFLLWEPGLENIFIESPKVFFLLSWISSSYSWWSVRIICLCNIDIA